MDSSWIELPNDHPDYLDGAVKFIKLAKENLVEGRTRCPCRRCKVAKWLPIEEVEQHILFKGFYKEYKHLIFHGKGGILDHVKRKGSTSQETNNDPCNIIGRDDMEGLLRAAFGVDTPGSRMTFYMMSKRTLKALGTRSSRTAQPLIYPSSNLGTAQPAIQSYLKPSTQPTLSLRASDLVVQQQPAYPSSSSSTARA
ncbi:hypothetical protein Cgig2_026197 [Carnegiea gigantea]|uniref:Transposase-associated domain-containing protein n=1 Tax=Carnegiea gigantea TaxID=171969 RepID=A0A9Q1GPF5_9CARY|nr:hypothetical protein Cgig2_026197 [Carnegiea gigantea]